MAEMTLGPAEIDVSTVARLIAAQFPQFAGLPLEHLPSSGTDNHIFRLGQDHSVRLPKVDWAALSAGREVAILPGFSGLSLLVPRPVGLGVPGEGYPWQWSVLDWIDGGTPESGALANRQDIARQLAAFILEIRGIAPDTAFLAGKANNYRGAPLALRDTAVCSALADISDEVDAAALAAIWKDALGAEDSSGAPVWLHGDIHAGNLLLRSDVLVGVIDFGLAGVGERACDIAPAWSLFDAGARTDFRAGLLASDAEWLRGAGWALSIAVIALAYYRQRAGQIVGMSRQTLRRLVQEFG